MIQTAIVASDAVITQLPDDCSFDEWRTLGEGLLSKHRETQWAAADWFAYGKRRAKDDPRFAEQLALALPEIAEDPKRLEQAAKVADAFPPAERTLSLSFDHYAALATLPHGEARKLLKRAEREHIPPRQLIDKAERPTLFVGDDELYSGFIKHWNRLPRHVRLDAAEVIADADGGEIEP